MVANRWRALVEPWSPTKAIAMEFGRTGVHKAVYTTRKGCSVACSCIRKAVRKLVTDVPFVYFYVESPIEVNQTLDL